MGYEGSYTITQRCASEFVATWMFIFLLESVLANKLLPKTKGHDIGFGWIALGVGLACFLPVQYFGYLSSMVNPAMALANCVAETIDWSDLLPIAICQFAGAFLGGCTVWLFYLPHFATVPEPPPKKVVDELLRTRDYIDPSSLAFASYSTYKPPEVSTVSEGIRQFKRVMSGNTRFRMYRDEDLLGRHSLIGGNGPVRRRSVNESDLHGRLRRHHQDRDRKGGRGTRKVRDGKAPVIVKWPSSDDDDDQQKPLLRTHSESEGSSGANTTTVEIKDGPSSAVISNSAASRVPKNMSRRSLHALANHEQKFGILYEPGSDPGSDFIDSAPSEDDRLPSKRKTPEAHPVDPCPSPSDSQPVSAESARAGRKESNTTSNRLHEASVKADQNAKLAVFATRPAMFVPICNLINEIIATMLLTSGILMLNQRGGMIWKGDNEVYMHGLKSFWVGILVVVLVLCCGGPGVALNPARDFGPRLAHWVLPIAGKGPSEWYYGWITVVGPFIGGALGGVFYKLCDMLNHSTVDKGYYTDDINTITDVQLGTPNLDL